MKAAFCVSTDSEVYLAHTVAEYFSSKGVECIFYIFDHKGKYILSKDHLAIIENYKRLKSSKVKFFQIGGRQVKEFKFDFVFLFLSGPFVFECVDKFVENYNTLLRSGKKIKRRPILVSGIPGLEIAGNVAPYLYRSGTDVYFINSRKSLTLYKQLVCRADKSFYVNENNVFVTGLPTWDIHVRNARSDRVVRRKKNDVTNVLFAGQNAFPNNLYDRTYLIRKLIEYCKARPEVILNYKPRNPLGIDSGHPVLWHEEKIIKELKKKDPLPSNFNLTYVPISSLLDMTDLCLTISSTVMAEAILRNIPVGIIKDPRLNQRSYGYWYFEKSGLFINFKQLREGKIPTLNKEWEAENLKADGMNCANLYEYCMRAYHEQDFRGEMKPFNMHELYQTQKYLLDLAAKRNNKIKKS